MGDFEGQCREVQVPITSSVGVRNATRVRIPNATFGQFLTQLPVVTEDVATGAKQIVETLRQRRLIKKILFLDDLQEWRTRPLTEVG